MTWTNYDDVVGQLRAAGLVVDRLDVDHHKVTRVKVDGDREKRGWYRLFSLGDLITGAYGIWSATDPQTFKVELPKAERKKLTADQLAAIKEKQKSDAARAEAERQREIEAAAAKAYRWWRQLQDAGESGYMAKKGFGAGDLFGARVSKQGNLVVPVQDITGKTWGLQVISAAKNRHGRDKDFTPPGLAKKGHFFQMGVVARGGIVLLCEGFATGASLRAATGLPVVVAFDAGNLTPVAIALHKAHRKDVRILVCADDDYKTMLEKGFNPGLDAAKTAALAVDGMVVAPQFPGERPTDRKGPTDFNDLHVHPDGGLQAVRAQIEAGLATAGWRVRNTTVPAGNPAQGGGGAPAGCGGIEPNGRRRALSVLTLDDVVERFISIDDSTGDFVFDTWTREVCKRSKMVGMLPAGVRGDDIKRHPTWLSRAVYLDQVGFDPGGDDANIICNRWGGWPTQPKAGSCAILLDLLQYLCSGEDNHAELYQWVLRWLAYPLQHPGAKMHSAIVVHGPQGTGKSRFFEAYAKIFGEYSIILNQGAIEDKFNADWSERKLFVLADEIVANTEKYHLKNQLKNFITSDWVRINPKNVAAHRERNHMNMVFLSNEIQPVVLENDDRRHCVIYTPRKLGDDFYAEVTDEINAGGIEALHDYLLNLDLGDFKPWTRPPMTDAKLRLIAVGANSEEQFITEWQAGHLDIPFCPISKATLYAEYQAFCRREGDPRPRPSKYFWAHIERLGWYVGVTDRLEVLTGTATVSWRCCIPSVEAMEKSAKQRGPWDDMRQNDGEPRSRWLCSCYWAVQNAIDKRGQEERYAA